MKRLAIALLLASTTPALSMQCVEDKCVCFTKNNEDCAADAVAVISQATKTIDLQAYNFTEPRISQAILDAKSRGVVVRAIFDKTDPNEIGGQARRIDEAGIPSLIDHSVAIAHNKVIIVDRAVTIGGSFNYSGNANTKNAENMTVITNPAWAELYEQNFDRREAVSIPFPSVAP